MDNKKTSRLEPVDASHGINSAILAKIHVHNSAGECTVSLTHPLAKELFRQAGEGHYLLCTEQGQDPLASITVRGDSVSIYPERPASDLAVGDHHLMVGWRMPLNEPTPGRKPGMLC